MSLKRKAEADYSLPSKRPLVQPHSTHADAVSRSVELSLQQNVDVVDLAPAGVHEDHQQQSEQQQEVPLSTCTELILYKPPPVPDAAVQTWSTSSKPPIVLGNGYKMDIQQPNVMSLVLRSLTPEQRASLKGIWDVLRDHKMLCNMLRKLPDQEQNDSDADDAVAAADQNHVEGSTISAQPGAAAQCIIEEVDSDSDDGNMAAAAASAAAVRQPATAVSGAVHQAFVSVGLPNKYPSPWSAAPGPTPATAAAAAEGLGPPFDCLAVQQPSPPFTAASESGQQQCDQAGYFLQRQQQQQQLYEQARGSMQQQQQQRQPSGTSDVVMVDDAPSWQQQQQQRCRQEANTAVPMDMDVDL